MNDTIAELTEERDFWKRAAQRERSYYEDRLREMHERFEARTAYIIRMNEHLQRLVLDRNAMRPSSPIILEFSRKGGNRDSHPK